MTRRSVRAVLGALSVATVLAICAGPSLAATPEQDVRATFERFVAAQNAHDLKAVGDLLLDSPSFLWIARGNPVWGHAAALKRFDVLYKGTWNLEPEYGAFRVVFVNGQTAQLFVPITFTIGATGEPAQHAKFFMNQVLTKTGDAWRISSILPVPVPK